MTGKASGVFFHEIFGHRIEGQRMKSESDGQTFKKKIGEKILNENLSVIMDPTMQNYNGQDLNGYYKYDDQGVKSEEVDIVKNGTLKGFLMSRRPIEGFPKSNGHGRAQAGMEPVTRQSNLIVTTDKPYTFDELKQILREEAKKQGLEYGYLFSSVVGGFTMTGRFIPNAFNVTPTEVYRIYVDGRPDELVRGVDLVGTPLSMFSQIEAAGGDVEVFTGTCGAESGGVPVTAISPALFVKRIEMQKKDKSQERPPILPRPGVKPDKN
jgi:predicted Zn-dependent protease